MKSEQRLMLNKDWRSIVYLQGENDKSEQIHNLIDQYLVTVAHFCNFHLSKFTIDLQIMNQLYMNEAAIASLGTRRLKWG